MLEFFVNKIYVYPDKLVMTFYYSEDQRELPFEETIRLIETRQRLIDMVNTYPQYSAPELSLNEEEKPDFFP